MRKNENRKDSKPKSKDTSYRTSERSSNNSCSKPFVNYEKYNIYRVNKSVMKYVNKRLGCLETNEDKSKNSSTISSKLVKDPPSRITNIRSIKDCKNLTSSTTNCNTNKNTSNTINFYHNLLGINRSKSSKSMGSKKSFSKGKIITNNNTKENKEFIGKINYKTPKIMEKYKLIENKFSMPMSIIHNKRSPCNNKIFINKGVSDNKSNFSNLNRINIYKKEQINPAIEENKKLKKQLNDLKNKYDTLWGKTIELASMMGMKVEENSNGLLSLGSPESIIYPEQNYQQSKILRDKIKTNLRKTNKKIDFQEIDTIQSLNIDEDSL